MTTASPAARPAIDPAELAARFAAAVGAAHVSIDAAERRAYSQDVFFWEDAPLVDVIVKPGTTDELVAVMRAAVAAGLAIAPRGGGVSYTRGYVADRLGTVLIDMARFDSVHEVNRDDAYMVVGAACTWQQVSAALKGTGLRTVLKGPISGTHATVGGNAAQNTASALMSGLIGLEVVLANGDVVTTGSGMVLNRPSPFTRLYGPDLTGLFLGDTGAFGIKTKCVLALRPEPGGVAFASVGFDTMSDMAAAMTAMARTGVTCRLMGMDPLKNRTATKVDMREGLDTLAKVATGSGSLFQGLKNAARIVTAGQNVLDDVPWSLHITVESHDQPAAASALDSLRPHWSAKGRTLEPSVPMALYAKPYSIRGILGKNGERWVPIHALLPLSRVAEAVERVQRFFAERQASLDAHGISHSYITVCAGPEFVLEPMFYWFDEVGPLHAKVLGDKYEKFKHIPANPAARATVARTRAELAELFRELGAVHSQLGKFYRFADNIQPGTYRTLTAIKDALDPGRNLNPGNLGWR